jgi:hypothetical protein
MTPRQQKLIAGGTGLLALVAAVFVLGRHLPWLASGSPTTTNRDAGHQYSPSEVVPASVPLPSTVQFSTLSRSIMPGENDNPTEFSRTLPGGVVVVNRLTQSPTTYKDVAETYRQSLKQAEGKELVLEPGLAPTILAAGPVLLPNETGQVKEVVCQDRHIDVRIEYGLPPKASPPIPKNKGGRPLADIPLLLDEGRYTLTVTWVVAAGQRADPNVPPQGPTVNTCAFSLPAGVVRSETIRVNGLDFQTLSESRCELPAAAAYRIFRCGVAVFNRGEKELRFASNAFHLAPDSLETSQGGALPCGGGRSWTPKNRGPEPPILIPPGEGQVFVFYSELGLSEDGQGFRWTGTVGDGVAVYYKSLDSGKYRLSLECGPPPSPGTRPDEWTGRLRTRHVEFELVKE